MSLLSFSWWWALTKLLCLWGNLWRKVFPSYASDWWLTVALRLGMVWYSRGLVLWGIISVFPWVGNTLALSERESCHHLARVCSCPNPVSASPTKTRTGVPGIVTDSRHLSFLRHPDCPQPKPVSMTAFLFYSPKCFCANDAHHWALNGSWPLCSREGHSLVIQVNKCWLHVLHWVQERLILIRTEEALRLLWPFRPLDFLGWNSVEGREKASSSPQRTWPGWPPVLGHTCCLSMIIINKAPSLRTVPVWDMLTLCMDHISFLWSLCQ